MKKRTQRALCNDMFCLDWWCVCRMSVTVSEPTAGVDGEKGIDQVINLVCPEGRDLSLLH